MPLTLIGWECAHTLYSVRTYGILLPIYYILILTGIKTDSLTYIQQYISSDSSSFPRYDTRTLKICRTDTSYVP